MGPTVIPLFGTGLGLPLANLSATQLAFGNSRHWTGEPAADGDATEHWADGPYPLRRDGFGQLLGGFQQLSAHPGSQCYLHDRSLFYAHLDGSVHWDLDDCG